MASLSSKVLKIPHFFTIYGMPLSNTAVAGYQGASVDFDENFAAVPEVG